MKFFLFIAVLIIAFGGILFYLEPHESEDEQSQGEDTFCAQVITPAKNPKTGTVIEFPTPCDVPEGWERIVHSVTE